MPQAVRIDTLRRAARLLGGVEPLARKLRVSPRQLEAWMNGQEAVPTDIFLRTVDLIEDSRPDDTTRDPPEGNDTQRGPR
jgi:hypothetical protein